jgi:hypothetical protein
MNSSEAVGQDQNDLLYNVNWLLFQELPEKTREVAFHASIPNYFDLVLLYKLHPIENEAQTALEQLSEIDFLQVDKLGIYKISDDLREILLIVYRNPEQIDEFIKLNQIVLNHLNKIDPLPIHEVIYHQLIIDESAGVDLLSQYFESSVECYQLGDAQNLLLIAQDLSSYMSEKSRAWVQYFQARLDFLLRVQGEGEESFKSLRSKAPDNRLRSLAVWHLGQLALRRDEWTNAVKLLRESQKTLLRLGDVHDVIWVMVSLGDVYIDLAENNGGVQPEVERERKPIQKFFFILLNLPFLLLIKIFHNSQAFPGWIGFGWGYQDWIILYLLAQAGNWYRKARRLALKINHIDSINQTTLSQARAEIAMHRWGLAEKTLKNLVIQDKLKNNLYFQAQINLEIGQVWLAKKEIYKAKIALSNALMVFRLTKDHFSAAQSAHQLALVSLQQQDTNTAVKALLEAYQHYQILHDNLSKTQIARELEEIQNTSNLDEESQKDISAVILKQASRSYLVRFPDTLLRWFRRFIYMGSIPLSYLLAIIGGGALVISFSVAESIVRGAANAFSFLDKFVLTLIVIFAFPLVLWGYHLVYGLLGYLFIRFLGNRLVPIQREQPDVITTDANGITIHNPNKPKDRQLQWEEVKTFISADYKLWQRPLSIASRHFLTHKDDSMILEGVTSGYELLIKDILRRVGDKCTVIKIDLVLLANIWTYLIIGISFLLAIFISTTGLATFKICEPVEMDLFSPKILMVFFVFIIFLLPLITLFRVINHRKWVHKATKQKEKTIPNSLLWLATIFLCLLVLIGFIFIFLVKSDTTSCSSQNSLWNYFNWLRG